MADFISALNNSDQLLKSKKASERHKDLDDTENVIYSHSTRSEQTNISFSA